MKYIHFNQEYFGEYRKQFVLEALNGKDFIHLSSSYLMKKFVNKKVFLTSSATTALEVAFMSAQLPAGSEVLIPNLTFPSSGNVVLRAGLVPVFCEVDRETLTLNLDELIKKISANTKAIIVAHYGGVSCDLNRLQDICKENDLLLFEDAATAFGATYEEKSLGTFGDFSVFSFHKTKNISAEQGGVLLLDSESFYLNQVEQTFEDGTNRMAFMRNQVAAYTWSTIGTNVRMTNLNSAVLYASLQDEEKILAKRRRIWRAYSTQIKKIENQLPIYGMNIPSYNQDNGHTYYVRFENHEVREKVRLGLLEQGIEAHFHYMPLHRSKMGKKYAKDKLTVSEHLADTLLRLPLHYSISEEDVYFVVNSLRKCLELIYE